MIGYRQARRIVIFVLGFTVVAAGVAMLLLPGPGWLTILLGLGVLATEFAWAARWLHHIKQQAGNARDGVVRWMNDEKPTPSDEQPGNAGGQPDV